MHDTPTKAASKVDPAAVAQAAATVARRPVREPVTVSPEKLGLAQYALNRWFCVVPAGTIAEDLDMSPTAFSLVAVNLTRGDDIRAITADDSRLFDLIVVAKGKSGAVCRVVQAINLPGKEGGLVDRLPEGFDIVEASSGDKQAGWLVVRRADGVQLNAGHIQLAREDAVRFLLDHASVRGQIPQTLYRT